MRAFQPHITLGRKVLLREDSYLNELSRAVLQQKMQVERISLMRSEIQQGVRMYKEVYSKELSRINQSIPCPVAYTHLDVYKRQIFRMV